MSTAILISGGSQRHMASANKLKGFLENADDVDDITMIGSAYLTDKELESELRKHLQTSATSDSPVLLYYSGHGTIGYWSFNEDHNLSYVTLANMLKEFTSPILVVNDCCHAHSIADYFQAEGLDDKKIGVISASSPDGSAYSGDLLRVLLADWQNHKAHTPQPLREATESIELVTAFDSHRAFMRVIHIHPRWRGIVDHLKYAFLCTFDLVGDLILGLLQVISLFIKKIFERTKPPNNISSSYESKRWGGILDSNFYASKLAAD
jgi:hypothetical protein